MSRLSIRRNKNGSRGSWQKHHGFGYQVAAASGRPCGTATMKVWVTENSPPISVPSSHVVGIHRPVAVRRPSVLHSWNENNPMSESTFHEARQVNRLDEGIGNPRHQISQPQNLPTRVRWTMGVSHASDPVPGFLPSFKI